MQSKSTIGFLWVGVAMVFCTQANAQGLITFVNDPNNGATAGQAAIGNAIQTVCPALGALGTARSSTQQDLFLRCNEMIGTAVVLAPGGGSAARDLGYRAGEESLLLAVLQQVSGEELHSQSTLATRVPSGQFSNIAGRLNALRIGGAGAGIPGSVAYADPGSLDPSPGSGILSLDSREYRGGAASGDSDIAGSRFGWFLEGSFNTGDRDQTANEDGFDFDATSVTVGLDYLTGSGVIGISAGIDNYDADFDNALIVSGGNVEVEGTSGSVFGAWNGERLYLDGLVSFGNLDTDILRRVVYTSNNLDPICNCAGENRDLTGETEGDYLAAGATLGFDETIGSWDVSTTLSLAYRDIDIDGYDETDTSNGGLALRFQEHTIESFRSIVGISFTRNLSRGFGILSPHFRAEWHHEFQDEPLTLAAKYVVEDTLGTAPQDFSPSACLSCFRFSTDEIDSDFALVGIGLSAVFAGRLQVYGVYDALLGLNDITSSSFSVGIRGQF